MNVADRDVLLHRCGLKCSNARKERERERERGVSSFTNRVSLSSSTHVLVSRSIVQCMSSWLQPSPQTPGNRQGLRLPSSHSLGVMFPRFQLRGCMQEVGVQHQRRLASVMKNCLVAEHSTITLNAGYRLLV